jgi:hypothetical protein
LLSNIYGHAIGALWQGEPSQLGTMVRYVAMGWSYVSPRPTRSGPCGGSGWWPKLLKLQGHAEETRIVCLRDEAGGFGLLGAPPVAEVLEVREMVRQPLAVLAGNGQLSSQAQEDHSPTVPPEGTDRGAGG